jgi:hypothetical protein
MFSRLEGEYKERIIRYWRLNMNERLMVIDTSCGPTMVLDVDPHEARFLRDTEATMAGVPSPDPKSALSSPRLPSQEDVSGDFEEGMARTLSADPKPAPPTKLWSKGDITRYFPF